MIEYSSKPTTFHSSIQSVAARPLTPIGGHRAKSGTHLEEHTDGYLQILEPEDPSVTKLSTLQFLAPAILPISIE